MLNSLTNTATIILCYTIVSSALAGALLYYGFRRCFLQRTQARFARHFAGRVAKRVAGRFARYRLRRKVK